MSANLVQLISDVHCDVHGKSPSLPRSAHTLVVAGDVCPFLHPKYRDFLYALTSNHRNVAYVPGNHEFYDSFYSLHGQAQEYMEKVCRSLPSNVVLLYNGGDRLDIPDSDISVVGATCWTNIDARFAARLGTLLNDFSHIRHGEIAFTPSIMNELHEADKKWLLWSIQNAARDGRRSVVVTHHCPDRRLSVFNDDKAQNGFGPLYYASDMGSVIRSGNSTMASVSSHAVGTTSIAAWCYGHTHEAHSLRLPESKFPFVTNAYGYPRQRTGYASGFCIKV